MTDRYLSLRRGCLPYTGVFLGAPTIIAPSSRPARNGARYLACCTFGRAELSLSADLRCGDG